MVPTVLTETDIFGAANFPVLLYFHNMSELNVNYWHCKHSFDNFPFAMIPSLLSLSFRARCFGAT